MTTKERFDELMFATCPTEEKGPFLWRWEEGARETLLTFIESEKKLAVEEERREMFISWDITDTPDEWCILIGRHHKNGTTEILKGISPSEGGVNGAFSFALLSDKE